MFFLSEAQTQDIPNKLEVDSENYTIFHWSTENGLPQNNIQNIRLGQNGLLWMTSYDGIVQFDGNQFKAYDESSKLGLSSSFTLKLETDEKDRVWFNTEKELCIIDSGRFYNFPFKTYGDINLLSFNQLPHFTWRGQLYQFKNDSVSKRSLRYHTSVDYMFNVNKPIGIQRDSIVLFDSFGKKKKVYPADKFWKLSENYIKISHSNEIRILKIGQNEPELMSIVKDRFKAESIISFHDLVDGHEIIETSDSIFVYEGEEELLGEEKQKIGIQKITSALMTSERQIWLGSNGGGLYLFQPKVFKAYSSKNVGIDISGNMIYTPNGRDIYFDGGCEKLFSMNNEFEIKMSSVNSCPWTMLIDYRGGAWINGMPQNHLNPPINHHKLMSNVIVRSSYQTKDSSIYISTNKGIIMVKNNASMKVKGSEELQAIYHFMENQDGELIFCGAQGVGRIINDSVVNLWDSSDGLATSDVRTVYQDSSGLYWLGYSKAGLGLFNGVKMFNFPFGKGRLNKNVWTIMEDDLGDFWMNSNQGIYCAKREELISFSQGQIPDFSSLHFSVADGLANAEGNSRTQNRGFKDEKGRIWFSMISGPAFIDPSSILVQNEYPIVLNQIKVDGEVLTDKPYVMSPGTKFINFQFTQSILNRSQQASYFYKFEGEEESWRPVGKSKEISLNEPKAGAHILLIKKSGGTEELRIPFEVKLHFWQTNFFNYSLVFAVTAIIFLTSFRLIRRRRENEARVKRLGADLKSLELRALQSQMNPHFIFNCLSSISALYLSDNKAAANDYLSRFSTLLRIILEHAQHRLISLEDDLAMFKIYVPLEALQFDEPFEFELTVDDNLNPAALYIPSMVTHTFIENAIKHGLKPLKKRKGKLKISVFQKNKRILINIEDNGVGYEQSILFKRKLIKTHKSRGLENTSKRINLINLLNDLDIKVSTKNLHDDRDRPSGTLVTVSFPFIDHNNEDSNS